MKILLCIDDTDDLEKGKGTGSLAQAITVAIEEKGWGKCERITRHQLLLHEDIPYTSHNSSMCFAAVIDKKYFNEIINFGGEFLEKEHAKGSDPGLCIINMDELQNKKDVIEFGKRAKKEVLTKEEAYKLAKDLNIHLSEHGGTGLGVIGALAGTGLRLSGNDGQFRGNLSFANPNDVYKASELYRYKEIDLIMSLDKKILKDSEQILFGMKTKTVIKDGKSVLLVFEEETDEGGKLYRCCSKKQLRSFGDDISVL